MTSSCSKFSIGAQIDIQTLAENPYPIFQQLIAHEPISWVPAFNLWMVTRREDVIAILRDWQTYTMEPAHTEGGASNSPMEDIFGPMMLSLDGAAHKRMREPFAVPFQARSIRERYATTIAQLAQCLIDDFIHDGTVDLDKAFSDRLALQTVLIALGLPLEAEQEMRSWYDAFAAALGNLTNDPTIRQTGKAAFQHFRTFLLAQLDHFARSPNDSVLSQILHDRQHDLTQDEIVSATALTFFGGLETTAAMFSNTVWALLSHPEQLQRMRNNLQLLPNAIEESLRWHSPVQSAMRFPTQPVTLHGITILPGEKIYCMLGAANRDPAFYPDPDCFDISRVNADKHLGFAYGPHFCFGAPLAKLEGEIGLSLLFQRLPSLQLDPERPSAPSGHEFRSVPSLHVTW